MSILGIYLGMSILDISKTLMYEFWYDQFKPKYEDKAKLCYTDTDNFIGLFRDELGGRIIKEFCALRTRTC